MTDDDITHETLVEQAKSVLEATQATMYYPVAHGEASRLQRMIEEEVDDEVTTEYSYEKKQVKRGDGVEIPDVATGVQVHTRWSVEEQKDYVVVEYLTPVGGDDADN